MKKFLFIILILSGLFLCTNFSLAEVIDNFQSDIVINSDSSIDVTETIDYDFQGIYRHGIFRNIPIKYQARGGNYNLHISNIRVTDESGKDYQFQTSYPKNNIEIKIGDPNETITGKKKYVISYTILKAINYFSTEDELYWNTTGNNWPVEIKQASSKVILPAGVNENQIKAQCFAGTYGSTVNCPFTTNSSEIYFSYSSGLSIGEGVTIVVGFSKGVVTPLTFWGNILEKIIDNLIVIVPIITLFAMFYVWYKKGRDPKGTGTIITQFDAPDGLTPAEVGTIIDEKVKTKDISAEIINLAVKGYIRVIRDEKESIFSSVNYRLIKIKDISNSENEIEQKFFRRLFGSKSEVNLKELKNKFQARLKVTKVTTDEIYEGLIKKGYIAKNPDKIRKIYLLVGIFIVIIPLIFFSGVLNLIGIISIALSGVIVAIFSFIMPSRTIKGVKAWECILGLKEYLSVAEKDRINFHNAPEKNPKHFEKLLPFAMVLGVEKEWAKQFEEIYNENPSWYNDSNRSNFNSINFVNNLNHFSSSANSTFSSVLSSASSGVSGFGGGFSL